MHPFRLHRGGGAGAHGRHPDEQVRKTGMKEIAMRMMVRAALAAMSLAVASGPALAKSADKAPAKPSEKPADKPADKPGQGNPKLTDSCASVALSSGGCLFSGNDSNIFLVQSIYNEAGKPGGPIALDLIAKFELEKGAGALELPGFGTVTGLGTPKGSFDFGSDWLVEFVSVKAGNNFLLYRFDELVSSGSWTTSGLLGGKDLSHISFFGRKAPPPVIGGGGGTPGVGAVPEPGTWAMLITGFGLVGLALRRRGSRVGRAGA